MVPRHYGVRTDKWKLMKFYEFDEWEFYDLEADPDELTNQYNNPDYASQIVAMKTELERLQGQHAMLLEKTFKASKVNRTLSDELMAQAYAIEEKIFKKTNK